MRHFTYIFIMLFYVSIAHPALAEKNDPKEKLGTLEQQLEKEEKVTKNLKEKFEALDKDLNKTRNRMVRLGDDIHGNETELASIEKRISDLEEKKLSLDEELKGDRLNIAKLILALERIRRTPPEAMIVNPEAPYKIAQTALIMGDILPSINRHAEELKQKIVTVNRVSDDLIREKSIFIEKLERLSSKQQELEQLVQKRETVHEKLRNDIQVQEVTVQQISLKAKDLKDLMSRLKEQERVEKERIQSAFAMRVKPVPKVVEDGEARLPVSGIIRTSFGEYDELKAKSNGMTIEGRSKGLVVAPMGGKIQFTGSFKRYGNIVIIEHSDGYHSLIAGLDKINARVGDLVKSGEPIGNLPDSSLIPRPKLYYELRKNGNPVNPSVKFSDLG